jgi:thiol-disulfide isomerase/thioredoxin
MKLRLLTLSLLCSTLIFAQAPPPSADDIVKEACKQATAEKKNVFVIFHASWCGWCRKMDTAMAEPALKAFFTDNYVIRHLVVFESAAKKNLENPGAEDILNKYKAGANPSIPYWLIFDKDGKLLADSKTRPEGGGLETGENVGCPASAKEVDHFIEVLKKTSPLKPAQLDLIRERFRKNEG